jgi:hypothetical protein
MRMNLWMRHVLRRVMIRRIHQRLDARYPLLLRGVDVCVCGVMSFGHARQHVRRARLFIEVRNANAAVFMVVVGTIILLLLRRPKGLSKILKSLLHALWEISLQFRCTWETG